MALVRFPPVAASEILYEMNYPEPTYKDFGGDPDIIANSEPVQTTTADFFEDGTSTVLNRIPHSQWYRYQPSYVHVNFSTFSGHPFLAQAPGSTNEALYIDSTMYNPVFANRNLAHWHVNGRIDCTAYRCVPPPKASIYAGTRK